MLRIEEFQAERIGFLTAVYEITTRIPRGQVLGYAQLGALIGKPRHGRQVGNALKKLPLETEIPWWRVIRSDGSIALQGDPLRGPLQKQLLHNERISFRNAYTINIQKHRWQPVIV